MECIVRIFMMLLQVERFQEQNENICITLELHYLSHTFDFYCASCTVVCSVYLLSCLSICLLAAT